MTREQAIQHIGLLYPADSEHEDTAEIGQQLLAQAKNEVYDAILAFGKKLAETLKPLFQAIHKACQNWEICWQTYEEHGTPYGKTDKGMMCELARAKAAIEREIAWREGMERLRVQIRIA